MHNLGYGWVQKIITPLNEVCMKIYRGIISFRMFHTGLAIELLDTISV